MQHIRNNYGVGGRTNDFRCFGPPLIWKKWGKRWMAATVEWDDARVPEGGCVDDHSVGRELTARGGGGGGVEVEHRDRHCRFALFPRNNSWGLWTGVRIVLTVVGEFSWYAGNHSQRYPKSVMQSRVFAKLCRLGTTARQLNCFLAAAVNPEIRVILEGGSIARTPLERKDWPFVPRDRD